MFVAERLNPLLIGAQCEPVEDIDHPIDFEVSIPF